MATFLSQEWLDGLRDASANEPEVPGRTARIQFVVSGGPDGDVKYHWVVENGRLAEAGLGELADAEVNLTETYADALAIADGELDPSAAFMQGRLKVTGNMGQLMDLLPTGLLALSPA